MKTSRELVQNLGIIAALSAASFGCAASSGAGTEPAASPTNEAVTAPAATESASQEGNGADQERERPRLVYTLADAGFAAPEAVLYDAEADVYFVSNVNGDPLAEDGNGFISKVGPDGKVLELKWIDGQAKGGTLNAPKGMAVSKGFLYVSDITWIRIFDRKTGEPKGKIFAKGATFLNGVAISEDGEVVFSDTGWKSGKEGYAGTGSDALYRVDPKTVAAKDLARGKELGNPNGLASTKDGLWVVNDQGELFLLGKDGKKEQTTKLAKGGLDGVVALDDGRFLVSSWKANAIFQGKPGGEFEVLLADLKSPASIGFDTKRDRILVPKMLENQVLIYDLSDKPPALPPPSAAGTALSPASEPAAKSEVRTEEQAVTRAGESQEQPAGHSNNPKPNKPQEKVTEKPAQPDKAAVAPKSGKPNKPAAASEKAADGKGEKAATPATPATPAQPAKPAQRGEPVKPGAPATPASPAQPKAPVK